VICAALIRREVTRLSEAAAWNSARRSLCKSTNRARLADIERHQILSDLERTVVDLARLRYQVLGGRFRDLIIAQQDEVRGPTSGSPHRYSWATRSTPNPRCWRSAPRRNVTTQGVVTVRTTGRKADSTAFMTFQRTVLVPKRGYAMDDVAEY
jgi:hypothetical protein